MKIEAVKTYEKGFMTQPFAFGGEEGQDKFDASVKYRASLQNYVIDTGDEVILVDTGMPADFADPERDDSAPIYNGERVSDYLPAFYPYILPRFLYAVRWTAFCFLLFPNIRRLRRLQQSQVHTPSLLLLQNNTIKNVRNLL